MLPQLAVSAKILCLLMVVICGAVPSMVRSVRLFNKCSHMYVTVLPNGTVTAGSLGKDQHANLTISTQGINLELLIYSPVQDMYICFNRNKPVGLRLTKSQAERDHNCLFKEEFVMDGYSRYYLVKNPDRYIGFNSRGMPLRRPKSRLQPRQHMCLSFLRDSKSFDIGSHNRDVGHGDLQPKWRPLRKIRPPPQNSLKPPCHHRVRHPRGRHVRRRNCRPT